MAEEYPAQRVAGGKRGIGLAETVVVELDYSAAPRLRPRRGHNGQGMRVRRTSCDEWLPDGVGSFAANYSQVGDGSFPLDDPIWLRVKGPAAADCFLPASAD